MPTPWSHAAEPFGDRRAADAAVGMAWAVRGVAPRVLVEIWSDVVCPWCYIGKRRFEKALADFEHRDEVEVRFRSFELQPNAPAERIGDAATNLARKYGMTLDQAIASQDRLAHLGAADDLDLRFDQARSGNTFDAHRLIHLAADHGLEAEVKDRMMQAYFTDGEPIGLPEALTRVAVDAGLDPAEVADVLAGDRYADAVRADEQEAHEREVSGVPYFLIDGRFAIPGAQEVDVFTQVLARAWAKSHP